MGHLLPFPEQTLPHPTEMFAWLMFFSSYVWDYLNRTCLSNSFLSFKDQFKENFRTRGDSLPPVFPTCMVKAPNLSMKMITIVFSSEHSSLPDTTAYLYWLTYELSASLPTM